MIEAYLIIYGIIIIGFPSLCLGVAIGFRLSEYLDAPAKADSDSDIHGDGAWIPGGMV